MSMPAPFRFTLPLFVLAGLSLPAAAAGSPPPSGLLLGLQVALDGNNAPVPALRTLWITRQGQGVAVQEARDIAAPNPGGWMALHFQRHRWQNREPDPVTSKLLTFDCREDQLLISQVSTGRRLATDKLSSSETSLLNTHDRLTFVGKRHYSRRTTGYWYAAGAAHNNDITLLETHLLPHVGDGLSFQKTFGNDAWIAFKKGLIDHYQATFWQEDQANGYPDPSTIDPNADYKPGDENNNPYTGSAFNPPDPQAWGIRRGARHWEMIGAYDFMTPALTGRGLQLFVMPYRPPESMVGPEPEVPWSAIKAVVPEATDAFIDPQGGLAAVLTPAEMRLYPFAEGEWAHPLKTVPLKRWERPVMAEWSGSDTESWQRSWRQFATRRQR